MGTIEWFSGVSELKKNLISMRRGKKKLNKVKNENHPFFWSLNLPLFFTLKI